MELERIPEFIRQGLEESLLKLGFDNTNEILQTMMKEPSTLNPGFYTLSYSDLSPNPDGVVFTFNSEYKPNGEKYKIDKATATKTYRPNFYSKKTKSIQREYVYLDRIPTKEGMTRDILDVIKQEQGRKELSENVTLRKELTLMKFNYDKLVSSSFQTRNGVTILFEGLPLLGTTSRYPKQVNFFFFLKEHPNKKLQLESVETSVTMGRMTDDSPHPAITYRKGNEKIPTKLEMIKNLSKETSLEFTHTRDREVDRLIKQAKNSSPKKFLSHYHSK